MQTLDHAAVAAGEFQQAAAQRPGNAERIGHRHALEAPAVGRPRPPRQMGRSCPAHESRAPRSCARSRARSGSSPRFRRQRRRLRRDRRRRVPGRWREPGGNTVAPGWAPAPGRVRLSSSKAWASAPLASAAAGACTAGPLLPRIRHCAAGPGALGIIDHDPAPRQRAAADAAATVSIMQSFACCTTVRGQVLVAQLRRIPRQPYRLLGHLAPLNAHRDCFAALAMTTLEDVIASLSPAYGRPAVDETGGKACGGAMMVLPSVSRSTLLGAGEPGCELDPRSLEDPHWCHGRQRPWSALVRFRFVGGSHPGGDRYGGDSMEVMHRRVAGLDVHKETVVACVRVMAGRRPTRECRTLTTTTQGLLELLAWLTASRVHTGRDGSDRRVLDAGVEDPERG